MKNPKKWTREEWRAWREARDARLRELDAAVAKIRAEIDARRDTAQA
jgi:hypothetical protein